mgnify:CR=1 FL=1
MKNSIKVLRAEKNMTQEELAKAIKVSRQTINAIEKGKFDPGLVTAFKIVRVFGKTIEEVFEYEE